MNFKLGDKVQWLSSYTIKEGTIVAVVPANVRPADQRPTRLTPGYRKLSRLNEKDFNLAKLGGGMSRDHKSYLVAVNNGGGKPFLYWPRVSALQNVEDQEE